MKRVLLIMVAALMISSVAFADIIGVYTDATAQSCNLLSGFTTTATVVYHGWTVGGSTGARFKVLPPAGSSLFGFDTPYVTIGSIASDLSVAFGGCVEGTFPMGTIVAVWAPGNGAVVAGDLVPTILMTDCSFGEYVASGFQFCVAVAGPCYVCGMWPDAVEQSTWGAVKALYR